MTGRVYYFILFLISLVVAERASAQATFTGGASQSLTVCQDAGAVSINTLLAAADANVGLTVNWTVVQAAAHGDLAATYTTTSTGATLTPTGLYYTPTPGYSGNDSFKVQVSDGIDSMSTMVYLTIVPLPDAGIITGLSTVCVGSTITLATTGTGGVWSASNVNAMVGGGGEVTGLAAGTVIISYSLSNICGTSAAIHNVTVNPIPAGVSITGATDVCVASFATLSTTGTGGVWASSATSIATVNTAGVVTGVTAGTVTISYTITTGCGATTATHDMTASVFPSAGTISGASTVCQTGAIAVFPTVPGGIWSSSAVAIANVGSSDGVVTGVLGGTALISYTVTNACGSDFATKPVTVNPLPTIGAITGITTVCGGIASTLSDTTVAGTWSSANPAIASVSSTGVVTGVTTGTTIISYSKSNSCGTNAATTIVAVGAPFAGTILGSSLVCVGTAITTLTTTSTGGTWSSNNTSIATVYPTLDGNVVIGGVSVGVAYISYTVVGTCGTAFTTFTVSVEAAATPAPISGTPIVCQYATTTLSGAIAFGTWTSGDITKATVTSAGVVTGVSGGLVPISYSISNSCGIQTAVKVVTVNTTPFVAPIAGSTTICEGDTMTVHNVLAGGTWSTFAGLATIIPTVSVTGSAGYITTLTPGIDTVYYTLVNSCGPNSAKLVLHIDSLPTPGVITGASVICAGTTSLFTPSRPGGTWSSSLPSIATVDGSGTVTGALSGTSIISYHRTNGCGTSAAVAIVTVDPSPSAGTVGGIRRICQGLTTTFVSTVPGGDWSVGAGGASSISPAGVFTAVTVGNAIVSYSVTNSCGSAVDTQMVRVRSTAECTTETPELAAVNGAELRIFPNPTSGMFNLMLASAADEEVVVIITNVAGQKVKELNTVTNKETAMQMDVPTGIYFLSARTTNGNYYTAKVVVTQ